MLIIFQLICDICYSWEFGSHPPLLAHVLNVYSPGDSASLGIWGENFGTLRHGSLAGWNRFPAAGLWKLCPVPGFCHTRCFLVCQEVNSLCQRFQLPWTVPFYRTFPTMTVRDKIIMSSLKNLCQEFWLQPHKITITAWRPPSPWLRSQS